MRGVIRWPFGGRARERRRAREERIRINRRGEIEALGRRLDNMREIKEVTLAPEAFALDAAPLMRQIRNTGDRALIKRAEEILGLGHHQP